MGKHDIIYKQLFSNKSIVSDLLRGFLKPETVKNISFDTLKKVNSSYASKKGKSRFDDLVWQVKYGNSWFYLYVLFEFQSTPDIHMPIRMLSYVSLLYEDLIDSKVVSTAHGKKLPPVLPILIYDGSENWGASTKVQDIILQASTELR
jgi:predicted transposase/invertase (TIGR01784 family)